MGYYIGLSLAFVIGLITGASIIVVRDVGRTLDTIYDY